MAMAVLTKVVVKMNYAELTQRFIRFYCLALSLPLFLPEVAVTAAAEYSASTCSPGLRGQAAVLTGQ